MHKGYNFLVMFSALLQQTGLSLDRLQSFCLVAEAGGVTKAAKGDPARQSLFSRQVKELEEFFGTELIRRRGRGVVLTPAGQRLNVAARECFASLWDFKSECQGLPVDIVIGAGESIIRWLLMPKLVEVQKALPNARLKFLNLPTSEIVRRLSDGLVDFGVLRKDAVGQALRTAALGTMGYSLFLPAGVKTGASSRGEDAKMLDGLALATLEGEGSFRQELAALARKHRLRLNIQLECSSFPLVATAMETGGLAAVLPSIAGVEFSQADIKEVQAAPLKSFGREICLAWNPRLLRIRTALDKAERTFANVFRM
ncbi:Transcriptional regulator, LysR family [Verrucomicrobia bacterium]|nr:Transcriptional regulator, LysR family [Verrucomicrobiota bacterium]